MNFKKIFTKIIISFFSILLFICIFITMLIMSSRNIITKENLANYIKNANVLNMDYNTLFNLDEGGITLKQKISNLGIETGIPNEIVNDILNSQEINNVLGDFFSKTIDYMINGTGQPQFSYETVIKMTNIANDSLNNHINLFMDSDELDKLILQYSYKLSEIVPNRADVIGNISTEKISDFLNFNVLYMYLLIFLIIVIISFIYKSFYKFLKHLGLVMLLSGVIFVIFGSMNDFMTSIISIQVKSLKPFILPLLTNALTICFKTGVLVSFSGLILFIIYVIINRMVNNKDFRQ